VKDFFPLGAPTTPDFCVINMKICAYE